MTGRTGLFKAFSVGSVLVFLLMCAAVQGGASPGEEGLAQIEQGGALPSGNDPGNEPDPVVIAADLIGIQLDALWEAVGGGKTIAEIAAEGGVDPQVIVDALLNGIQAEIDAELAGGHITAEEAAQWLALEKFNVAEFVNEPIDLEEYYSDDDGFLYEFPPLVAELLGMEENAVWEALKSGQSLAQLAEERGVNPRTIIDAVVEAVTAEIDDGDDLDEIVALFVELSGMEEDAVWEALDSGQTLAQLAGAQGVDPQVVIDALVEEARAEIDSALADGLITAEEAALWLSELEAEAAAFVNEPIEWDDEDDPLDKAVALFVELSGMEEDAVWEALDSGQTLAQLAGAQGVDPQAVIDALVEEARVEIDSELADGFITAEEAALWLSELEAEAAAFVNEPIEWDDEEDPLDEAVALFVELSGMEEDAVWEALNSGQSLAQLAGAQGVDPQVVIDALVEEARVEIDSELADGFITAEEAVLWLSELEAEAAAFVNEPIDLEEYYSDDDGSLYDFITLVAELTGTEEDAAWEALMSGRTLAQLAETGGVDPQAVYDAVMAGIQAEIDAALGARK